MFCSDAVLWNLLWNQNLPPVPSPAVGLRLPTASSNVPRAGVGLELQLELEIFELYGLCHRRNFGKVSRSWHILDIAPRHSVDQKN